ncbi:MAG: hypothetical protein Roseis2KO_00800 [Roseivirga sp.]
MEVKTGHFYVRNKWSKEYSFLRVASDKRGAFYALNDTIIQRLERGTSDDLEKYEVIEELPHDYKAGYHEGEIQVTVKNRFGHIMEFRAKSLLVFAQILEKVPALAKALDINAARSYKRKKRERDKDK